MRNHHPVPLDEGDAHVLSITTDHGNEVALSVADLKKNYTRQTVTATMQCSGNRRGHMNQYGKTSGTAWGSGAASTAEWAGVPLRVVVADLLFKDKSTPLSTAKTLGASPVIFEAKDDMQASVPVEKALSELGLSLIHI